MIRLPFGLQLYGKQIIDGQIAGESVDNADVISGSLGLQFRKRASAEGEVIKQEGGAAMTYKGYTIQAAPHELIDTGLWALNLFILWSTATGEKSQHFYTSDQYTTKEEATAHCIGFGQLIIDGQIRGLSVASGGCERNVHER